MRKHRHTGGKQCWRTLAAVLQHSEAVEDELVAVGRILASAVAVGQEDRNDAAHPGGVLVVVGGGLVVVVVVGWWWWWWVGGLVAWWLGGVDVDGGCGMCGSKYEGFKFKATLAFTWWLVRLVVRFDKYLKK